MLFMYILNLILKIKNFIKMEVKVKFQGTNAKTYNIDPQTTVGELIEKVKKDNSQEKSNVAAILDERKLNPSEIISQLHLKENSDILMYVEASHSAPPKRKRIAIPQRTDIDYDMKAPADLEDRISQIQQLFDGTDKVPDRETIITALENSYYNLDRAVDYLLPVTQKPESSLTEQEKKDIVHLSNLGYKPGTAIQVYFQCNKDLQKSIDMITLLDPDMNDD